MARKPIGRILGYGFLDFIPYVEPVKDDDLPHVCAACTFYKPTRNTKGVFHYQQLGKVQRWKLWLRSGWYCKYHIWDAIYQDGEINRYKRWQRKYFAAIQDELDKYPDFKKVADSADVN